MLKRVAIENLRGVRSGEIKDLSRLVVLVGPNGSGKSTVLEACLIGGTRFPATAVGIVVRHRSQTWNGARWLVHGGQPETPATVEVEWEGFAPIRRRIHWDPTLLVRSFSDELSRRGASGPLSAFRIYRENPPMAPRKGDEEEFSVTGMAANNEYLFENVRGEHALTPPFLRFVEPLGGEPLHDLFSRAVQRGHKDALLEGAKSVVPGLKEIEILTEDGTPRLFLTFGDRSIPATLGGEGLSAMLRVAFELATPAGGTVLLEEPEVHQHPRSLMWCARAIVAAVRSGVQVILTTHSLELVDKLLAELSDEEIAQADFMTVGRTRLVDGTLSVIAVPARSAEEARTSLEEDLR